MREFDRVRDENLNNHFATHEKRGDVKGIFEGDIEQHILYCN